MLAASPLFGLFSRALPRTSFLTRISAWSYTCCFSNQCGRKNWQHSTDNVLLERKVQQNGKLVTVEKDLLQNMQQNGSFMCSNGDLSWNKMETCSENFRSSSMLHWNRYRNNMALKWPVVLSKPNILSSSSCLEKIASRNLHTIASMHKGKFLNSKSSPGKISLRHKSFGSVFKKLFLKLLKDVRAKEEALKEIETKKSQKETKVQSLHEVLEAKRSESTDQVLLPTKELLSDLIYGCTSSKHLLNLLVPWIENKAVTLDDTARTIEHLQNLVYSEIMEMYPNLPYGSVSIMFDNLKLLKAEEKVFSEIHDHIAFKTVVKNLEQSTAALTNSQFATCFSCLTHLGIPHIHPLMGKFYTRLMNSNTKGYTVIDIVNLYNVAKHHGNTDLILAAYVVPKLRESLKVLQSQAIDVDTFRALLFTAGNVTVGLRESEFVLLYSYLYKVCMETNCLDNLNCACELLLHLNRKFYIQKEFVRVSSIYYMLLETHRQNIIQAMSDLCVMKIKYRSNELSPLKIKNLINLSKSCFIRIELHPGLWTRVEYFLKERLHQLSLPELIWTVSGRRWNIELGTQVKTVIASKFEKLDLPNLYEAWGLGHTLVRSLDISDLITKKTLEYKDEIIEHEKLYMRALTYSWGMWYRKKDEMSVDTEFDTFLQEVILEIYQRGRMGCKTHFASSVLMSVPRFSSLQPSSLYMLPEVAMKQTTFQVLSQGNIYVLLHTLFSNVFNNRIKEKELPHLLNRELYESLMLGILYKTVLEFNRTMQQDTMIMHVFIRTANLLLSTGNMDCFLQTRVYEKLTNLPLQYVDDLIEICNNTKIAAFVKISKTQRNEFLNNVVSFALENKDYIKFRDWRKIVNFLLRSGYSAHENMELQKTLQTVVHEEFSLGPAFCFFVNRCCRLGVDMSKALKIIFSVEYLNRTDQLISDDILQKDIMQKAMFHLNQTVCVSYPSLNVPWFQDESDAIQAYGKHIRCWKNVPNDLLYAISWIAGGDRFVGKEVLLEYGMPAWRVLLVDEQNKHVEFTTRNLKLANEMKYNIYIIWYIGGALVPGAVQVPYEMMIQSGYKVVVIYRAEWHSLALSTIGDKIKLLKKKIIESSENVEVQDPPMVNCKHISDQWKQFLEARS